MTTYTPPRPGVHTDEAALANVIQRACEVIAAGWERGTRMNGSTRELIHEFARRLGFSADRYIGLTNPGVRQTTIEPVDTDVDGHSVVCAVCGRPARALLCAMDEDAVGSSAAVAVPPQALCVPHLAREQAFVELVLLSRSALRHDVSHIRRLIKLAR